MAKGLAWLKNIWSGVKNKAAHIEDAERVTVDSSALHCPICLRVFSSTPFILPCGHSFCQICIRRLIEISFGQHENIYQPTFECALCRNKCSCDAVLPKNYIVDALLQSMCEIALEDDQDFNGNLKVSLKAALLKLNECEKKNNGLQRALDDEKKLSNGFFWLTILLGSLLSVFFIQYLRSLF